MSKEKQKTSELKKPYYELSDAVYGFKYVTSQIKTDETLKTLAQEISELQDKIHKHLNEHYLWD